MLMAHGFLASVFEIFARHRCAIDIVSTSEVSISVTVDSNEAIPAIAADLEKLAYVKFSGRMAIICLVGESIRERPGVAAQVFDAVKDINVRMISQGASEINMSFVVDEADVPGAIQRLHSQVLLGSGPRGVRLSTRLLHLVLLGQGKTGSLVAEVAAERGHSVTVITESENQGRAWLTAGNLRDADAVIDFTTPGSCAGEHCWMRGRPEADGCGNHRLVRRIGPGAARS